MVKGVDAGSENVILLLLFNNLTTIYFPLSYALLYAKHKYK